jgi:outer membrane protein assembly factor BamB
MKRTVFLLLLSIAAIVLLIGCDAAGAGGGVDDDNTNDTGNTDDPADTSNPVIEPGTELWSTSIGDRVVGDIAYDNGRIYAVSDTGFVYALSENDGSTLWTFDIPEDGSNFGPVVAGNGNVHVVAKVTDDEGGIASRLIALDGATGSEEWSYTLDAVVSAPVSIDDTNTVYVVNSIAGDDQLVAIETPGSQATAISPKWTSETLGFGTSAKPTIDGDGAIILASGTRVYSIRQTDGVVLRSPLYSNIVANPALGSDGTIFVGTDLANFQNGTDTFYAIDPSNTVDGETDWSFPLGSADFSSAAIAADGTVYVGAQTGKLYAFNPADGSRPWTFDAPGIIEGGVAVGDNGTIYFAAGRETVLALSPDGTEKWRFYVDPEGDISLTARWKESPLIAPDGTVYIGALNGRVFAIEGSSNGPANSSWPMKGYGPGRAGFQPDGTTTSGGSTDDGSTSDDGAGGGGTGNDETDTNTTLAQVPSDSTGAVDGTAYGYMVLEYYGNWGDSESGYNTDLFLNPSSSGFSPELYFYINDNSDSVAIDPGTYTLNTSGDYSAGTLSTVEIIGQYDNYSLYTWDNSYGASTETKADFEDIYGPTNVYDQLVGGTVTVSVVGDDYTLSWRFDTADGEYIEGSYTGPVGGSSNQS